MTAPLQLGKKFAGTGERLRLLDQTPVQVLLRSSDLVARPVLDFWAGERLNQLVAAHTHRAVQLPEQQHDAVLTEGPVPGDRVVVARVDERAVEVDERGKRHGGAGTRAPP